MAIEKTVSEIAEILGVSRQAVNNRVKALAPEDTQKNEKGATLRLVLYTTDFEITVRDQTDYQLTIDLAQSSLHLPEMTEAR